MLYKIDLTSELINSSVLYWGNGADTFLSECNAKWTLPLTFSKNFGVKIVKSSSSLKCESMGTGCMFLIIQFLIYS